MGSTEFFALLIRTTPFKGFPSDTINFGTSILPFVFYYIFSLVDICSVSKLNHPQPFIL
jgi:hypothetical protein